jgi:hypothetical protein
MSEELICYQVFSGRDLDMNQQLLFVNKKHPDTLFDFDKFGRKVTGYGNLEKTPITFNSNHSCSPYIFFVHFATLILKIYD